MIFSGNKSEFIKENFYKMSCDDIIRFTGISKASYYQTCYSNNLSIRDKNRMEMVDKIDSLNHLPPKEISDITGFSLNTVYKRLRQNKTFVKNKETEKIKKTGYGRVKEIYTKLGFRSAFEMRKSLGDQIFKEALKKRTL